MSNEITFIKKNDEKTPYVVIYKPSGLPSAPLSENDKNNAFSFAVENCSQLLNVNGRKAVEHGLLHRLDNVTSGLLLIASTQEFYDYMLEEQELGRFTKTYSAVCNIIPNNAEVLGGFPPAMNIEEKIEVGKEFSICSMFRPFGEGNKSVRPVTKASNMAALKKVGKKIEYITNVKIISIKENTVEVECKITAGFRHQIRNHLAWIGLPIKNDGVYNSSCLGCTEKIEFCATGLEFYYPKGDLNSYVLSTLGPEPSASTNSAIRA